MLQYGRQRRAAARTLTVQQVGGDQLDGADRGAARTKTQFQVQNAIADAVPGRCQARQVSLQSVGPSWGSQISQKALEALIAFLVVIVLYLSIAFEWRMATAALVALAARHRDHDRRLCAAGLPGQPGYGDRPADHPRLLAVRHRRGLRQGQGEYGRPARRRRRTTYSEAANLALNQTLVRSINTSLIALLPVASILAVSMFLLGNGELKDLSLVLFVGMLSGTYSSICIATPVLADLKEREPEYRQLRKQIAQRATQRQAAGQGRRRQRVGRRRGGR